MQTTDKTGVSIFIDQCVKHGVRNVVCSPGSRNAPLVIAIDCHPEISSIVIHDERSAAFYALGMAQQLGEPVAVVCTSGSAMLNYYPAVAEAFYQEIPLVVFSADRPSEWVNQGDGQTIVQSGVYENHIRYQAEIKEFVQGNEIIELCEEMTKAFESGNGNWKGPIHFNIPLSEPLYGTVNKQEYPLKIESKISSQLKVTDFDFDLLREKWSSSKRKMILCGQLPANNSKLVQLLAEMGNDSSVVVLVENTSNLIHPSFIHCVDRTLSAIASEEIAKFQPEVLITIGGAVISKRIKRFLRESQLKEHWKLGFGFPEMNTYEFLSNSFECRPADFFKSFLSEEYDRNDSTYGSAWKQKDFLVQDSLNGYFDSVVYSDMKVFETILDYIPEGALLHMGNSSVVRYCQLFDPIKSISYFSNRGTSGIDGCTSTACGAALVTSEKCNVLITGDVSFFYDSNAFWSNHLPKNLRVILVNNSGGGIFRIIEGPSGTNQLEKYFEAQHSFSAEYLCKAFDVQYKSASSSIEVEESMSWFYEECDRPKLIEIKTPNDLNDRVLKEFFKHTSLS